jgi:hypothetical protein
MLFEINYFHYGNEFKFVMVLYLLEIIKIASKQISIFLELFHAFYSGLIPFLSFNLTLNKSF